MTLKDARIVDVPISVTSLAVQIGKFMQYWGFKEIHGQIWAHVWLANSPLDATTLVKRLDVSKALVSLAIKDLVQYDVIKILSEGDRRKMRLVPNTDVYTVITNVLKQRESKMLESIVQAQSEVMDLTDSEKKKMDLNTDRVQSLVEMTVMAQFALRSLVESNLDVQQFMHIKN
jgi:DNA-binding transcriptional regulator GbsR (MarR family)